MIKLTRGVVERVMLLSFFLKERGYDLQTVLEEAIRYKSNLKRETTLREIYQEGLRHEGSNADWDSFMLNLKEQLEQGQTSTAHHPGLIDLMVDVLQAPHSRNVLAGKTLNLLRKAMLFPEEMSKVGEAILKEKSCASCGKAFNEREVCTAGQTENGGMAFFCSRCISPVFAACKHTECDGAAEIDSKIIAKLFDKCDCGQHGAVKTNPGAQVNQQWVDVGVPIGGGLAGAPQDPRLAADVARARAARRAAGDRW